MKISALIIAATLGAVTAAPISLIYITNDRAIVRPGQPSSPESIPGFHPLANIRLGHAAAFASVVPPNAVAPTTRTHADCSGLRAKMDKVREMFGLPRIMREDEDAGFHIMPVPASYPHHPVGPDGKVTMMRVWRASPGDGTADLRPFPASQYSIRDQLFLDRLQHALNQLGPWEARAVTFVLGCGLGVLLKLFMLIGILLLRARRGDSRQAIQLPVESQVIFIAPPQYNIEEAAVPVIDEKVPVYEELAPQTLINLGAEHDK